MDAGAQAAGAPDAAFLSTTDVIVLVVLVGVVIAVIIYRRGGKTAPPKSTFAIKTPANGAGAGAKKASSRSILAKMNEQKKDVVLFYGSQTGTAEDYAGRLSREAKQFGFDPLVADMEDYDLEELKQFTKDKLVFFVVATYGEGEPTDNSQEAYKLYKEEEHDAGCMANTNFVVFGLGNKTYEHYNSMGKFWDSKLAELGGHRVFELGLGDDDGNLEEDFLAWKEQMWPAVCKQFNKDMEAASQSTVRQFALKVLAPGEVAADKVYKGEIGAIVKPPTMQTRPPYDIKNPYYAELKNHRDLMQGGDRTSIHLEILIKDTPITYATGDHVGIFPQNDPEEVERLGKRLGIADLDGVFTMTALDPSSSKKYPFPCPTTYRTALTYYLDIMSVPRTHILKAMIDFATTEKDRKHLVQLTGPEGKEELHRYLHKDSRHLLETLDDFPSVKPPVDLIFELLPRLQCRYYSISSSPKVQPDCIGVCLTVLEYNTPTKRLVKGVATNWLNRIRHDFHLRPYRIPIFVRKSNFKPPRIPTKPIIMVGPGTGLAPFRGFIQERAWLKTQGKEVGPNVLFYGCRDPKHDFLYEAELKAFVASGDLELHTAFSRAQKHKVYVQNRLLENKKRVYDLLQDGGYFYVCGDAKNMAREVTKALVEIVRDCGGKTEDQAAAYVKDLRSTSRYVEDVWS